MVSSPRFQENDFGDRSRNPQPASPASGPEAIERLLTLWQELAAYAAHYLAARVDLTKGRLRRVALFACAGLAAAAGLAVMFCTAAVLLVIGAAQGLAAIFGGPAWVGQLLLGGGVLLVIAAAAGISVWWINRTAATATQHKYEQRKRDQRQRFGRDASGEATTGPAA